MQRPVVVNKASKGRQMVSPPDKHPSEFPRAKGFGKWNKPMNFGPS
jgi:hypothetical protein